MKLIRKFVLLCALTVVPLGQAVASDLDVIKAFYSELLSQAGREDLASAAEAVLVENWSSTPTPQGGPDRKGMVASLEGFAKLIPDLQWIPQEILQDGNTYTVRSLFSGTPVGPFLGIEPSGKRFEAMSIDIHTVENGLISTSFHVENWLSVMRQLSPE